MHEQACALDVREELVAQPGAIAGALDQPRNVGDHQLALVAIEHAEHRRERRERVVGDLRRGARQARQQRGLAGIRQADEADVGDQLQLQLEPPFLARQAALGKARRLARRRREALVALAAGAAARDCRALADRQQLPAAPAEVAIVVLGRRRPPFPAERRSPDPCRRLRGAASLRRARRVRRGSASCGGTTAGRAASRRRPASPRRRDRRRRRRARRAARALHDESSSIRRRRRRPVRRSLRDRAASRQAS